MGAAPVWRAPCFQRRGAGNIWGTPLNSDHLYRSHEASSHVEKGRGLGGIAPIQVQFRLLILTAYLLLITEAIGTYVGIHFLWIAKENSNKAVKVRFR